MERVIKKALAPTRARDTYIAICIVVEMIVGMKFLDIAKTRYSARSYKDKSVEKEKLDKILESAHVAPTAANLQPVRLLVVQEKEGLPCNCSAKHRQALELYLYRECGTSFILGYLDRHIFAFKAKCTAQLIHCHFTEYLYFIYSFTNCHGVVKGCWERKVKMAKGICIIENSLAMDS